MSQQSELSLCCHAPIRWLNCEACEKENKVCDIKICTNCGSDIEFDKDFFDKDFKTPTQAKEA